MPVIVTASSKGGAGKSTLTLILAQALDAIGASVTIIDADPNRPLVRRRGGKSTSTVDVVGDVTESNIIKLIREHSATRQFVLVDLEGTANRLVSRAITQADLVLIPLQASALDSNEASRAVGLIQEEEETLEGRVIPYRIIMTRTNPLITTKIEAGIYRALEDASIPLMKTRLHERQAYKAIFVRRLALTELDESINGLEAAKENAERLGRCWYLGEVRKCRREGAGIFATCREARAMRRASRCWGCLISRVVVTSGEKLRRASTTRHSALQALGSSRCRSVDGL